MGKDTKEKGTLFGKIVKIVLLVVITCIVIFAAHTTRNFLIIRSIVKMQTELTYINNATKVGTLNNSYTTTTYKKNNMEKNVVYNENKKSVVWITYKDTKTGEEIKICDAEDAKFYKKTVNKNDLKSLLYLDTGLLGYEKNTRTMIAGGIHTLITSEKVEDKDCYKIKFENGQVYYIEKSTGLLIKADDGNNLIVTYTYDFSEVSDEIFKLPDLSTYELRDF